MDRIEELDILLKKLKEIIRALPINLRKPAVSIYYKILSIYDNVKYEEEKVDEMIVESNIRYQQILDSMNEIIEGEREVTKDEIDFWKKEVEPNYTLVPDSRPLTPIPKFWSKFLSRSNVRMGSFDKPIFLFIKRIHTDDSNYEDFSNPEETTTMFIEFYENPFILNPKIKIIGGFWKEEEIQLIPDHVNWKANPTVIRKIKQMWNRQTGQLKIIYENIRQASFFEFFDESTTFLKTEDVDQNSEQSYQQNFILAKDVYESIEEIRNNLPYALEYFLHIKDNRVTAEEEDQTEEDDEEVGYRRSSEDDRVIASDDGDDIVSDYD